MTSSPKSKTEQYAAQFAYLLIPELRSIVQEAKKKHPPVKDACERAMVRVGTLEHAPGSDVPKEPAEFLRYAEEYWKPLITALDCKNPRLTVLALEALRKLLSHGLLLPSQINVVVSAFSRLGKDIDENSQLKVLQCLMSLYSSGDYELTPAQMPAVFTLAFAMYLSKNSPVQSTAGATITQITVAMFDRLTSASAAAPASPSASPSSVQSPASVQQEERFGAAKTAYLFLKDLCTLASGEAGQFIKLPANEVPKTFVFDLMYIIIKDHSDVTASNPQFTALVREDLSLVLAQNMKSATDLPSVVRLHRLIAVTLQRFPLELVKQQELFISLMAGALDQPEPPLWYKASVLSCWRELAENYFYLRKMYSRFDHSAKHSNLFETFVGAVCGMVKKAPSPLFAQATMSAERMSVQRLLAVKADEEPPAMRPTEPLVWAVDVIVAVCKSLSKLVEIEGRPLTDAEVDNNVEEQTGEDVSLHMLNAVWSQVLTACGALLERSTDEEIVEETLRCFKQFTHACGKVGLANARDSFIAAMNKFTLPQNGALTQKNVQVLRVLFDVANCLGGVLDSSWYLLLTNFQQLQSILNGGAEQASQADLALIRTLLSKIFEGTLYFEDAALLSMVNALCQLSVESVAASQPVSPSLQTRYTCSTFGLQRLADIAVTNIDRLHLFWQVIHDHVAWLVKDAQNDTLRKCAVETASAIILAYLKRYRTAAGALPSPAEGTAAAAAVSAAGLPERQLSQASNPPLAPPAASEKFLQLQPRVIEILRVMKGTDKVDVRIGCLNLIFTVIERAGQELVPESWRLVLGMLATSSRSSAEVTIGFKSVELVYSDFMPIMDHDGLQALIVCVGQYAQQTAVPDRTNTNLSAIQQGLLSIADFCSSLPPQSSGAHWSALFIQLRDVASDSRPEVRHSSMKTLFNALVTHGSTLPAACWSTLFWDVLLKVLDSVHSAALAAEQVGEEGGAGGAAPSTAAQKGFIIHHSRNTPAKQWYETRCTVLDGVVRIVKIFYPVTRVSVSHFTDALTRLSVHLANACTHHTDEVAVTGLRGLHDLLVDICAAEPVDGSRDAAVLWEHSWTTWEQIAEAAAAAQASSSPQRTGRGQPQAASTVVLTTMVEGLAELYTLSAQEGKDTLRGHVQQGARRILPLLGKVMDSSAATDAITFPSKLQMWVIRCLQAQPVPADNLELQRELVHMLCSFLPRPSDIEVCLASQDKTPKVLRHGKASVAAHVFQLLKASICGDSSARATPCLEELRRSVMDDIVEVCNAQGRKRPTHPLKQHLRSALMTRHLTNKKFAMWEGATDVLGDILSAVLPSYEQGSAELARLWTGLLRMVRDYLQYSKGGGGDDYDAAASPYDSVGGANDAGEKCDDRVLHVVQSVLLPFAVRHGVTDVLHDMLEIVEWCSKPRRGGRALSDAAMQLLFGLCDTCNTSNGKEDEASLVIGKAAIPRVVARCSQILDDYIADDKKQGRCPLPQYRRDEVVGVLNKLATSHFSAVLFQGMEGADPPTLRATCPAAFGPKGLAVRLFPALIQYVNVGDDAVKQALADVMLKISAELGLPQRVGGGHSAHVDPSTS